MTANYYSKAKQKATSNQYRNILYFLYFYNLHPGSIKDIKTLINMLMDCDVLNVKKIKFLMDKGFYGDTNIN